VASTPIRTCVGCRGRAPKADLVRVVTGPGGLRVDPDGTAPGRGAYVHAERTCVGLASQPDRLARALRTGAGPDELGRLMLELERMGAV
jgi:predicted RNA-binding protein YlxR (DUF448 family)